MAQLPPAPAPTVQIVAVQNAPVIDLTGGAPTPNPTAGTLTTMNNIVNGYSNVEPTPPDMPALEDEDSESEYDSDGDSVSDTIGSEDSETE